MLPPWQARRRVRRNWLRAALHALRGTRPCPACGGRALPEAASWMHAYLRCRRCALIFVADLPSADDLEAAYRRVHQSTYQVEHKRDWRPWIAHKHHTLDALGLTAGAGPALDVGCGEGHLMSVLRERGFSARGIELNPVLADQARALGFEVETGSVERAAGPPPRPGRAHGGGEGLALITANHLIEHLRRPFAFIRRAAGWLGPGGSLVLETPLRPDYDNIDHLYCFSAAALERALLAANLTPRRWFDYLDDNYGHHNLACRADRGRARG